MIESNTKNSVVFPILVTVGSKIMKLDAQKLDGTMNSHISSSVSKATDSIKESVQEELTEAMPEAAKEMIENSEHH